MKLSDNYGFPLIFLTKKKMRVPFPMIRTCTGTADICSPPVAEPLGVTGVIEMCWCRAVGHD